MAKKSTRGVELERKLGPTNASIRAKRGRPIHAANRPQIHDSRTVMVRELGGSLTFELRAIQCGKGRCRKWHGPYWYAAQKKEGRTRWVYVGKRLDVGKALERMRAK